MTISDAFNAYACTLSRRLLRRFMRFTLPSAANDNAGLVV